jgi:non-canonical purine NTP pyrophosphatase (RdgB/HAM1 family)
LTRLYCATGNAGKVREFRMAANAAPVEIELLANYRELPECVEDGSTFEENAIKKARHYGPHAAGLLFADDSGLEVDALGGAPGVYSARYSGPGATDASNNALLLERMRGVANRTAGLRVRFDQALLQGIQGGRPSEAKARKHSRDFDKAAQKLRLIFAAKQEKNDPAVRTQVEKTLAAAAEIQRVILVNRFNAELRREWEALRGDLNALAQIYSLSLF